jgi:hypothetical protein
MAAGAFMLLLLPVRQGPLVFWADPIRLATSRISATLPSPRMVAPEKLPSPA